MLKSVESSWILLKVEDTVSGAVSTWQKKDPSRNILVGSIYIWLSWQNINSLPCVNIKCNSLSSLFDLWAGQRISAGFIVHT